MTLVEFNVTSIGASHIRVGKECQDFSYSEQGEGYAMAISCDGHGGGNYFRSAFGSRFAAQSGASCISEFLQDWDMSVIPENPDEILIQLEKSIITKWNTAVWDHYEANPFTEDELNSVSESRCKRLLSGKSIESTYGTTLIALVQTEAFWFGIQIGDGKAVKVSADGIFDQPIPANEKCFLNSTTSICDENAIEDFRHVFSTDMPAALFCGSDGIDDSFIRDEQLYKLYSTVGRSFVDNDPTAARNELKDYLPRLSSKGSGDDVSIAGIVTIEIASKVFPEIEEPTAKEPPADFQSKESQQSTEQEQGCENLDKAMTSADSGNEANPSPLRPLTSDGLTESLEEPNKHMNPNDDKPLPQTDKTTSIDSSIEEPVCDQEPANTASAHQSFNSSLDAQRELAPQETLNEDTESQSRQLPNYCEECGFKFSTPVKFCPECGVRVEKAH